MRSRRTVAEIVLHAVVASHPYRDAIVGDIAEQAATIQAQSNGRAAHAWYRRAVWRTAWSLLPSATLHRSGDLRVIGVVLAAYAAAVRGTSPAVFAVERALSLSRGAPAGAAYLVITAIAGAIAAYAVCRFARSPVAGALILLLLALTVGAAHIAQSAPHELAFRAVKVCIFVLAMSCTAAWSIAARAHVAADSVV